MAAIAFNGDVSSGKRKVRAIVIKRQLVELDDIECAALVIRMAMAANIRRGVLADAVQPLAFADISCNFLVAIKAELVLR